MNALSGLTFIAMPRRNGTTPQHKRRSKPITHSGSNWQWRRRRATEVNSQAVVATQAFDGKLQFVVRYDASYRVRKGARMPLSLATLPN